MNINTNSYFYFIRKMLPGDISKKSIPVEYHVEEIGAIITDEDTESDETDFDIDETESDTDETEYELEGMHYDCE